MDDLAFLEQLVAIPSPSGQEDALAEFLIAEMRRRGFQVRRDEAGNAIGVIGNPDASRKIVLLGHMDTVTPDIPVRRRGDTLYGRGAVDAKGPLAAFILAAERAAPRLHRSRVIVIGAVEEESPRGRGAHYLADTMQPPYCTIVGEPSTWQGITLGYKGILSVDYRLRQPGGHSAGQFPGPAQKAVAFWNRLVTYSEELNHGQSGHFDTLDPALRDFHTFSQGSDELVEMNIVLRLPPGVNSADLKQQMEQWSNGAILSFPGYEPSFQAEKNTPPVRALLRSIRAEGGRPHFKLKTGTSDMNVVGPAWNRPIVAYGPGDSSLDHTPDEHMDAKELQRAIRVLTRALEMLENDAR